MPTSRSNSNNYYSYLEPPPPSGSVAPSGPLPPPHRATFGQPEAGTEFDDEMPRQQLASGSKSSKVGNSKRVACDQCIACRHRCEFASNVVRDKIWIYKNRPECLTCKGSGLKCTYGDTRVSERLGEWTSYGALSAMDKRLQHLTDLVAAAIERSGGRETAPSLVASPTLQDTSANPPYQRDSPSPAEAHRIFAARELANAREAGFLLLQAVGLFELAWLYAPLAPSPPPKLHARKPSSSTSSVDWNQVPNDYDTAEIEQTMSRLQQIQRASDDLEESYEPSISGSAPASSPPSPASTTLAHYDDCRRTAPLPRTPLLPPPPFEEFESAPIPGYSILPISATATSPLADQPFPYDTPPTHSRSKTRPRIFPPIPRRNFASYEDKHAGASETSRETMVDRKASATKRRALSVGTLL